MGTSSVQTSRRTVLKGAAWSVPVVAVAASAPLAAASTTPADVLEYYITAYNVSSTAGAFVEMNGLRLSPRDPVNPVNFCGAASNDINPGVGTVYTAVIDYLGSDPAFDFLNTPGQTPAELLANKVKADPSNYMDFDRWDSIEVLTHRITLKWTVPFTTHELSAPNFNWPLDPSIRPENQTVAINQALSIAEIPQGCGFPNGGGAIGLIVDPNQGTGSLEGPTHESWPPAAPAHLNKR